MQDYFSFFDIPRRFTIDKKALRIKYITNSRAHHPDFFTLNDTAKQEEVLRLTTLNNEAYKVLSDDRKRMQHILRLNDMFPDEGKAQVPQEFLIEMMDVNEQLMEAQMSDDNEAVSGVINELEEMKSTLSLKVEQAMESWDRTQEASFLIEIRDIYLKQQYVIRLQDRLKGVDPEI